MDKARLIESLDEAIEIVTKVSVNPNYAYNVDAGCKNTGLDSPVYAFCKNVRNHIRAAKSELTGKRTNRNAGKSREQRSVLASQFATLQSE